MKYQSGIKGGSTIIVCIVLWNPIMNGTGVTAWEWNLDRYISRFHRALAPIDPCVSSPCGPNSECRSQNNYAVCSCLPGCIGSPPNCRPECEVNDDCANRKICKNGKCLNPCNRFCGINARCTVVDNSPVCSCWPGQTGNPLEECFDITEKTDPAASKNLCNPSPCGPNSQCISQNDYVNCSCISGYIGSPPNCSPECEVNENCAKDRYCSNGKCVDVCAEACGIGATCIANNHNAGCTCLPGKTGNPFWRCTDIENTPAAKDPCVPSPCGPYSQCESASGNADCSCISGYMGTPPNCRPACEVDEDCAEDRHCTDGKCLNVCPGTCGINATCVAINHKVACTCLPGQIGDPLLRCTDINRPPGSTDPCNPWPCPSHSECQSSTGRFAVCPCSAGYRARELKIMKNNVTSAVGICVESSLFKHK